MLITRTKVRGFKAVTIKDIPTRIATRHYFALILENGKSIKKLEKVTKAILRNNYESVTWLVS